MWAIDCPLLTDLSILELSILPNLRRLALAGLPLVTDISLLFLAEHGTWLKHLQIAHCERMALHTIHVLVRRLERLAYLSTSGVVSTSRIGIKRFSETPPGVRIIRKNILSKYTCHSDMLPNRIIIHAMLGLTVFSKESK